MENVSNFPAKTGHDPHAYTAPCNCCGQVVAVTCYDKNPPMEQLQDIATEKCQCDGAKRLRVMKRAEERIPMIFGDKSSPVYGGPVEEKVLAWLTEAALLVATDHLDAITIKINSDETATIKGGAESVKITRKRLRAAESRI